MTHYPIARILMMIMCGLLVLVAFPVWSQEFSALGGAVRNRSDAGDTAGAWQLEYLHKMGDWLGLDLSYLNEGHFLNHHRDGYSVQLWGRVPLGRRFLLAGGIGPYFYFDTTDRIGSPAFRNEHGLGTIVTLSGKWYFREAWFINLRTNWVWTDWNINTFSFLAGFGLDLDRAFRESDVKERTQRGQTLHAVSFLLGNTTMNNIDDNGAFAWGAEYWVRFGKYLEGSLAYIHEGHNDVIQREGLSFQLWAVDDFFKGKLTFGIGLGPYLARHREPDHLTGKDGTVIIGMFSIGARYRVHPNWFIQAVWNRMISDYDRDADIVMLGPGFAF